MSRTLVVAVITLSVAVSVDARQAQQGARAGAPVPADTALTRALAVKAPSVAERAHVLSSGLTVALRLPQRLEWYPRLEQIVDELDASTAATFEQTFAPRDLRTGRLPGRHGDEAMGLFLVD